MARRLAPTLELKIKTLINSMLQGYDFEIQSIKIGEDWSGDEAIFVELSYKLNQQEFDPKLIGDVLSGVRSMLVDNDEDRFPYINHHFAEGQKLKAA